MSPDHLPIHWRNRGQRLRMEGNRCETCGTFHFPPKIVCPNCVRQYEVEAEFFELGTVKTIFSNKKNEERGIEISVEKNGKNFGFTLNLNGLSHSAELKVGMSLPIFVKRINNKLQYLVDLTSSSSK